VSHALQFFKGRSTFCQIGLQEHFDSMVKQISANVRALSVHRESRVRVILVAAPHEEMSIHKTLVMAMACSFLIKKPTQKSDGVTDGGNHGYAPNLPRPHA
jgi:hypothetical protein